MDNAAVLAFLAVALAAGLTAAYAGARAAPWLPTPSKDVERALDLAGLHAGETLVDLGCGDGRVLLAAARRGARAVGYELSLLPYLVAHLRRACSRNRRNITIHYGDFFRANLAEANVIFCFLMPRSLQRLNTKCIRECKPQSRLVSYVFAPAGIPRASGDKPSRRAAPLYCSRIADLAAS